MNDYEYRTSSNSVVWRPCSCENDEEREQYSSDHRFKHWTEEDLEV